MTDVPIFTVRRVLAILLAAMLLAVVLVLTLGHSHAQARGAWCRVSASYNSYYKDYDVYVHSNQPYRDAQVWQKGHDVYGYKTNGEGYADVYVFAEDVNAREGISIRVGRARCGGRL